MSIPNLDVRPIAGALGAEIQGVDISTDLPDGTIGEIRRALLDHQVIFFRDQDLTPEQHLAFARRFGELQVDRFVVPMDEYPQIMEVVKEPHEKLNFGGVWHTDVTFQESPSLGSLLYAREVPAYGGDTMWTNEYLAYETLSDGLRGMLDGMKAVHSARAGYGREALAKRFDGPKRAMKIYHDRDEEAEREVLHPVVRTHPETGRKSLFVNRAYTVRFDGWTEEESMPLLAFLYQHSRRPEFTCRFRWSQGTLAFWDNRCTQHYPINDYHGHRRVMHRITVAGDRPV